MGRTGFLLKADQALPLPGVGMRILGIAGGGDLAGLFAQTDVGRPRTGPEDDAELKRRLRGASSKVWSRREGLCQ